MFEKSTGKFRPAPLLGRVLCEPKITLSRIAGRRAHALNEKSMHGLSFFVIMTTMNRTEERAYAKLNLTLGVRAKRMDGYHELDMLMQTVDLYDTVTVTRARDVEVTCAGMLLPYRNTLRTAAELYRALTGRGAHIRVVKRIPQEAGLGGGSADAAAVLRAMDRLYGEIDRRQLYEIGRKTGADVPFCLYGGLCRAEGIGELLTPLSGMPLHAVIVKPESGVSTRALFQALTLPRKLPDTAAAIRALANGDLAALAPLLFNALEEPACALVPDIGRLKARLLETGAAAACMTGSGSAVFGLYETQSAACDAARALTPDAPFCIAVESV